METTVTPLDDRVRPILHNKQALALDEFINNYDSYLKERFETNDLTKEELMTNLFLTAEKGSDSFTSH